MFTYLTSLTVTIPFPLVLGKKFEMGDLGYSPKLLQNEQQKSPGKLSLCR